MANSKITLEQYIGFRKKHAVKEKKKLNIGKIIAFIFLALLSRNIKKNIYIRKINVFANFN